MDVMWSDSVSVDVWIRLLTNFFYLHRLGGYGAPHGLAAGVIGDCTAEAK